MTTKLEVGDKVKMSMDCVMRHYPNHKADLIGTIHIITEEWIWVNWGLGEIWNHTDRELEKVEEVKK